MHGAAFQRFKSTEQAQRFLDVHAAVYNLFNLSGHRISAERYRNLRIGAFGLWEEALPELGYVFSLAHRNQFDGTSQRFAVKCSSCFECLKKSTFPCCPCQHHFSMIWLKIFSIRWQAEDATIMAK
jgi:hypothetical protein